jgi:hypothetical protein
LRPEKAVSWNFGPEKIIMLTAKVDPRCSSGLKNCDVTQKYFLVRTHSRIDVSAQTINILCSNRFWHVMGICDAVGMVSQIGFPLPAIISHIIINFLTPIGN